LEGVLFQAITDHRAIWGPPNNKMIFEGLKISSDHLIEIRTLITLVIELTVSMRPIRPLLISVPILRALKNGLLMSVGLMSGTPPSWMVIASSLLRASIL
jgi:hypothetical protein